MTERRLEVPFDPLGAASRAADLPGACFLYSGLMAWGMGRYSILTAQPSRFLVSRGRDGDPFALLERELADASLAVSGELPFHGGFVGYLSYDCGRCLEQSQHQAPDREGVLARFGFYQGGLVFDHLEEATWLVALDKASEGQLEEFCLMALEGRMPARTPFALQSPLESNFSRASYLQAVEAVRQRIRQGDVYQVNLSQRFSADCSGAAFELFRRLVATSPAAYSAYLNFGDEQIVSSSPERLLQVSKGVASTRPIKGTRPAGSSEAEREANAALLAASEKDRSELLMIVDLERNDLGKVCRPGSVRVDDLFGLEHYATVIHQTADVSGALEPDRSALDCVRALYPGGSITGAPKIRAMQLIDELERGNRGVYTGSIGYFDLGGGADLNIAIRTIKVADGSLSFQVGGGIVWDSDPESEYEETLLKAAAMVKAMGGSLK